MPEEIKSSISYKQTFSCHYYSLKAPPTPGMQLLRWNCYLCTIGIQRKFKIIMDYYGTQSRPWPDRHLNCLYFLITPVSRNYSSSAYSTLFHQPP